MRGNSPTKAVKLASLLSVTALLSACGSTLVATVEPVCEVIADTCISKDDKLTEGTAKKIEGDNLSMRRMCKRSPQCGKPAQVATAKTS